MGFCLTTIYGWKSTFYRSWHRLRNTERKNGQFYYSRRYNNQNGLFNVLFCLSLKKGLFVSAPKHPFDFHNPLTRPPLKNSYERQLQIGTGWVNYWNCFFRFRRSCLFMSEYFFKVSLQPLWKVPVPPPVKLYQSIIYRYRYWLQFLKMLKNVS